MGPVVGNQEAAQIFINYMYDIVIEISFLDINDCPNLSRSNWKLQKELLKTQNGVIRYQIFLHMVDGHEKKMIFYVNNFFGTGHFFDSGPRLFKN